eukprot:Polyplicarium_translucidae@DN2719_c0_g1_i4.p2
MLHTCESLGLLRSSSGEDKKRCIVFFQTKQAAHFFFHVLRTLGYDEAIELHGNLPQVERSANLQSFTSGKCSMLIATEIASRGLDIEDVDVVINFDLPLDEARYVHRVGRTARIGRAGQAVTFFSAEERLKAKKLGRKCVAGDAEEQRTETTYTRFKSEELQPWLDKIKGAKAVVVKILVRETTEREARKGTQLLTRGENMAKHTDEIMARGKRQWIGEPAEEPKPRRKRKRRA